jgi:tetratricopeptide (TPR) repeat protein
MIGQQNYADVATTNGSIALANLEAQVASLEAQMAAGRLAVAGQASLVELVLLRGHLLGCIADYERALALAGQLLRQEPHEVISWLMRARARATLHYFEDALSDLDLAKRLGADRDTVDAERAAIVQALGRSDEALVLRRRAVDERADFAALGALAVLQAERGEFAEADLLFALACWRYQGVAPFPIAMLDFQRGLMWLERGDLEADRAWFQAACCRVPAYAAALGHLAEVDIAEGQRAAAIERLRPLAARADDPEYAALLAGVLGEAGQVEEACVWRTRAAARYEELAAAHPAAFADHAAEFWLTIGADTDEALELARQNLEFRQTSRARALFQRAAEVNAGNEFETRGV